MLNRIILFSINNKLIIWLFLIALIGYGGYEVTRLPIDAVPDITDNQVQVITVTPSLGAPDVERLITFPVEQACSNIPSLKEIRSFSRFGLSLVTIVFNDDADVYWARQQVTERLQKVQNIIPTGVGTPELAPVTTGLGEVYQYVVKPKKGYESRFSAMDLRTIQDWIIRRQLLGVKGVADVSSFGGYLKQYEIAVNTSKLQAYNLTITDIFEALKQNNQNTGGAYIERGPTVLYIRSEGLATGIEDIRNIVVKTIKGGIPLTIRDIADVRIGAATRYGAMCYNAEGEVAGAVVMMLKGANSGEVIKNIKERIAHIQKTLPEGVIIEPFLDRTKMVNNAIGTVEKNLLEGSLIVVFILIVFLGNLRAGLIVASVIPLSMLFAVIMMNLFGVSGNLMSLGALDFGLIVDGAVIIVEAVMHKLVHSKLFHDVNKLSRKQMDEQVTSSASKMMNSAVFGQIIILIVYLPIFSLQGIEGKMFRPMAQTVAFALLGAFILSLTYVPMMSAFALDRKVHLKQNFSERMMLRLEERFDRLLQSVLRFPKTIITITILLFGIAILFLYSLGGEFIPQLEEGDFAVDTRVLTGSNLNTTIRSTNQAAQVLLQQFPEVKKVVTKIGSGEIPTDPMPIEAADMMVVLKDKKEWTSAKNFPELAEKMSNALTSIPGITTGFQFPVQMRFNELMTGARQDVVCKIFGENLDTLATYAGKLGNIISKIDGARDIYVERVTGMPQIVVQYDRDAIAQYGLNIAEINEVINTAFAGQSAGMMYEGERRFDLVVRLEGVQRQRVEEVQNLMLPLKSGVQIPLSQVARVEVKEGPNQIQREDAKRRIIVGFNVRGRDVQSIVKELQQKVIQEMNFPPGYYVTYGGAFENLVAAKQRLSIAVPIALALIFLMLYFAFGSVKYSLLIYTAIPLSSIGGIMALATRGMPFSISAGIGFIALFGVAVLNGIVLISEFSLLKKNGMRDVKEIVLKGTRIRLRPVLMTACVASLGFLPMALSNGAGAEVQRPLATVVIGGLLTSTLLTLFLLPILYMLFEHKSFKTLKNKKKDLHVLFLLFTFLCGTISSKVNAQQPILLNDAIDTALHHNRSIQSSQLRADYLNAMKYSAWNIPATNVSVEFGNVNSFYSDNKFSISQTLNFPTVYSRKHSVFSEEAKAGAINLLVHEKELIRDVSLVYADLIFLTEKIKLLKMADSIYNSFSEKSTFRFEKGAANILEKATAQNQLGQINQQLLLTISDFEILQMKFKLLLNTDLNFVPVSTEFHLGVIDSVFKMKMDELPSIELLNSERKIANAQLKLEQSLFLPELFLGYYNQSFQGWQKVNGIEQFYGSYRRFQSSMIGIGLPLFFNSQTAKIKSAKISKLLAENNYQFGIEKHQLLLMQHINSYNKTCKLIADYKNNLLKNSELILKAASDQLVQGDIDYLQYVLLINQTIATQSDYLETLRKRNIAIIELNYLTTK